MSFTGSNINIYMPLHHDLFESNISRSVYNYRSLKADFDYILFFIGIIDDLNLNTRIWSKQDFSEPEREVKPEFQGELKNIIAGLPGGEGSYDRDSIRSAIELFTRLGNEGYRQNLFAFLEAVIPVAEESGVIMAIHPDDPPFSLFGLPRVVSTADDARTLLNAVPSPANGLTMCAGSYGARSDNDLVEMVREFHDRIYFVHLRNIKREADGSFYESDHLDGDNDIVGIVNALLDAEQERQGLPPARCQIPMRPDHGHALGEEASDERVRPGYSYAGRMKGLAELRGVIHALVATRQ